MEKVLPQLIIVVDLVVDESLHFPGEDVCKDGVEEGFVRAEEEILQCDLVESGKLGKFAVSSCVVTAASRHLCRPSSRLAGR